MDKNICSNDDNVEPADAGRGEERVVISTDWLLWGGGDGNDGDDGDDDDDGDVRGFVVELWKGGETHHFQRTLLLQAVSFEARAPSGDSTISKCFIRRYIVYIIYNYYIYAIVVYHLFIYPRKHFFQIWALLRRCSSLFQSPDISSEVWG